MLTCEPGAITVEMLLAVGRASAVGARSTSELPRPSASRRARRPPDPEQLQRVVGEAGEEPLGPDLDRAAEREEMRLDEARTPHREKPIGALHSRKTGWVEHTQPIPSPQSRWFLSLEFFVSNLLQLRLCARDFGVGGGIEVDLI